MGLGFEPKTSWEILSTAITGPNTDEGRLWWKEIENYRLGQTNEKVFGYQYKEGSNFPIIYEKVKQVIPTKKSHHKAEGRVSVVSPKHSRHTPPEELNEAIQINIR